MSGAAGSKVPAAFQAMLAFLRALIGGAQLPASPAVDLGIAAAVAVWQVRPDLMNALVALRDLVQAAADEHAGSASPASPTLEALAILREVLQVVDGSGEFQAGPKGRHRDMSARIRAVLSAASRGAQPAPVAPSASGDPFAAIKANFLQLEGTIAEFGAPGIASHAQAHIDRAWLIGEVERLRAEQDAAAANVAACSDEALRWAEAVIDAAAPPEEASLDLSAAARAIAPLVAERDRLLGVGVDPAQPGSDRTVTQVREPAFDRLAAAVDKLEAASRHNDAGTLSSVPTPEVTRLMATERMWKDAKLSAAEMFAHEAKINDVARSLLHEVARSRIAAAVVRLAFDAYAASRATLTGTASTAETLTFTRLEGETPEAFRARIALHLNGMGSTPFVLPGQGRNREALGQIVHAVRSQWEADNLGRPALPWSSLWQPDRDLSCAIGVALATVGQGYAGAIDAAEPIAKVERPSRNKMTRAAYQQVIAENIAWCEQQPRTLERDHIILILQHAVAAEYPRPLTEDAATAWADEVVDSFEDGTENPDEMIREALLAASRGEYPTT